MKRPSREERRKAAKREIARGDPRKSHEDCPIQLAIDARRPPEVELSPFPQDDLVETPAPRPSLAPFGVLTEDDRTKVVRSRSAVSSCDYVELHARSAFSFLRAASLPEDLAHAAASSGHRIFGLADVGGLYGIPRFHATARRQGVRPLVGAELDVEGGGQVALLCEDRGGYKNLCRLLTLGHATAGKDGCRVTPAQLADFRQGLVALSAGTPRHLVLLAQHLGTERLFAEVQRHMDPSQERENRRRIDAARARGLRIVASGGVRHAAPEGKPLFDALTCIRLKTTLDAAGRRLSRNAERHVRPPREIAAIFRDLPETVRLTREIADRCAYTLDDLGYELPEPQFLHAASLDGELWHRTMDGAGLRYGRASSARRPN